MIPRHDGDVKETDVFVARTLAVILARLLRKEGENIAGAVQI